MTQPWPSSHVLGTQLRFYSWFWSQNNIKANARHMRCDNRLLSRILKHLAASAEQNSHNENEPWLRGPSAQSQKPHCRARIAVSSPATLDKRWKQAKCWEITTTRFWTSEINFHPKHWPQWFQLTIIHNFSLPKVLGWYPNAFCIMTDYSTAIIALVVVGIVFTVAVVYVLAQPSDLPADNKDK